MYLVKGLCTIHLHTERYEISPFLGNLFSCQGYSTYMLIGGRETVIKRNEKVGA